MQVTLGEFAKQARDALANLYDPVALNAHPLSQTLAGTDERAPGRQSGAALRQRLIAAIEGLKPGPQVNPNARAWRPYRILQLRYVEGRDPGEVQHQLSLSKSQYYREQEAALESLVALLWEQARAGADLSEAGGLKTLPYSAVGGTGAASGLSRWRVIGASGLGVLVALSVLFFSNRASRQDASSKARAATDAAVHSAQSTIGAAGAPVTSVTLSVYAGNGQAGHVNGAAAKAQFSGPFGLSVDSSGTLYVADTGNQRIRSITTTGVVLDVAGSGTEGYADGPRAGAQFSAPNAVTVGPDGTVYVGDAGNLRIRAINPSGTVSTLAGSGVAGYVNGFGSAAQFAATGAVIADAAGNVYVPDRANNVIRRITPTGVVSTFAGSGIRGHLDGPAGVAQFNAPQRGGGVDGAGNVYVLDTVDNRIRKITPNGIVSTVAGTGVPGFADGAASDAKFSSNILGVITDASGNLYVMDAGNRRVRMLSHDGIVTTLFEFTNPDQAPGNIKVDKAGNLFLSDREHNVIYKLTVRKG